MIQNKDIVVVKGDKDSSLVIMKEEDYVTKLDIMIDDGIMEGIYIEYITEANLKCRPIIDQTGTFTYNPARVILDYFRPCKNVKMNIPSMIHKNFQACYLQSDLCKMMRNMYYMMLSHYLQIYP